MAFGKRWFCDVCEQTVWVIENLSFAESNSLPHPPTLSQVSKLQEDVTVNHLSFVTFWYTFTYSQNTVHRLC
jgi:hypothetical protein